MLVQYWGILLTPLPHPILFACTVALVNTLAHLHNYNIDEVDCFGVKGNPQIRLSMGPS
jgi:hypothetical protein